MQRVAVIGSGVAGLTAAWSLRNVASVTVYEADARLGGHAHSHEFGRSDGGTDVVDTGFIVMNDRTYPTLLRIFDELGVTTQPTEMSMSVSCGGCGLEYAGARKLAGLFASERARKDPRHLRLLSEVPRFHRAARRLLATPDSSVTLQEFLTAHRFSPYFVDHFAIPLVACVWSCPAGIALEYPAQYLFAFLEHHGMLRIWGSPKWRTVVGGSRSYVNRIAAELPDVRTGRGVRSIVRHADGSDIRDASEQVERFDQVVIATHPDQALRLLADATPLEKTVLGAFEYSPNRTQLHSDERVLPSSTRAQASWNYRTASCGGRDGQPVVVTYDMNRLQGLAGPSRYLVTLNAAEHVDSSTVLAEMQYEHPQYTPESVAAQRRLPELSNSRVAFAGAYHGWGFHEDGARSGVAAARRLGAPC